MAARSGEWDMWCPVCGLVYTISQMSKRWDGIWVCHDCWEEEHPLRFARPLHDDTDATVVIKPRIKFGTGQPCANHSAIPGDAIPGCMWPGTDPGDNTKFGTETAGKVTLG